MSAACAACRICSAILLAGVAGFLAGQPAWTAGPPGSRYLVESELWIDGRQRAAPVVIVEADEQGSVEVSNSESGWRLVYEIEPPARDEGAGRGAMWLHVGIYEKVAGRWDHITDTMLGLPDGRSGSVSITNQADDDPAPATARLYLRVSIQQLRPGEFGPYGQQQPTNRPPASP